MREFTVSISKHRPDGLLTLWVYAKRKFSQRELNSKARRIWGYVRCGVFPARRFSMAITQGFDILESSDLNFYFAQDIFVEFLIEAYAFPILLSFLQRKWGGKWHLESCEWTDYFTFDKDCAEKLDK